MSHFTALLDRVPRDVASNDGAPGDRTLAYGAARVPIAVLTGFLGSGKTTLLNALLQTPVTPGLRGEGDQAAAPALQPLRGVAVIVNEFGDVGIDQDLLAQACTDDVLVLPNGCLCCSVRGDLLQALQTLWARHQQAAPDQQLHAVLLETSGLADPGPILRSLAHDPWIVDRFVFRGLACTLDAVLGARTLDHHPEARHQLAVADEVLVTKLDQTDGALDPALVARVAAINPVAHWQRGRQASLLTLWRWVAAADRAQADAGAAGWVDDPQPAPDPEPETDLQRWGRSSYLRPVGAAAQRPATATVHSDGVQSFVLIRDEPLPQAAFSHWLDMVIASRGEDLLRVKGWVQIAEHPDQPWVVHGVQHVFSASDRRPAWPSTDHRTRLVFITRGLDAQALGDTLDVLVRRHQRALRAAGSVTATGATSAAARAATTTTTASQTTLQERPCN